MSTYANALQERLHRVQAEIKAQGAKAVSMRQNLESAQDEADATRKELGELKARWAADQPRRDTFLRETGEAERTLAEQERRCIDALAAQASAQSVPEFANPIEHPSDGAPFGRGREKDFRQRLTSLEDAKSKLSSALLELREAAQTEGASVEQLRARAVSVRKEIRALHAGAAAARDSEGRVQQKHQSLEATIISGQQRQQVLERQVADLRNEVQGLRSELKDAVAILARGGDGGPASEHAVNSRLAPGGKEKEKDTQISTWATNRKLQTKVASLRDELRKKLAEAGS